ncbi:MAG: hypothetical protein MMC23_004216 [Stictis urceolatum]|nr:hypothetical protein [Stictis urceolata]
MSPKSFLTRPFRTDYNRPPPLLHIRSHTLFITTTIGVGLFTDLFLYGLLVPIIPFLLQERLDVPKSQQQTLTSGMLTAYAGASVLFSPIAGFIADRTSSRQLPFLLGLILLLLGCLGLYLGQSVPALILARILQGLSAAVVWTVGLALCLDTVGPGDLGKTIGTIFSITSVGELAAPVLGGVLYKKAGDEAVFGLSAGLLVLDFVMRILLIEKKVARRYYETTGKTQDGHDARSEEQSADDADQDQDTEANEDQPLLGQKEETEYKILQEDQPALIRTIPVLYCFRNPSLLSAMLVAFVQALLLGVIDSTVSTHAEDILSFHSLRSGLLFLPIGIVNAILGPVAGWAVDRFGTKLPAVFGYSFLVPVLVALRAVTHDSKAQLVLYCALLALVGVGLASIGAPSIVEAGTVVQKYEEKNPGFFGEQGPYAQLYGINSMVFNLGLTVGPILAGSLKDGVGYGNMNAVVAGICAVTAGVCFMYIGGRPKKLRSG